MRPRIVTAPHLICYINGNKFARLSEFKFTSDTPQRKYYGLDSLTAFETIPLSMSMSAFMSIYRTHYDGGIEGAGMQATWEEMTLGKYFSFYIRNRLTDKIILQANKCSVISQKWDLRAKTMMIGGINFTGLFWSGETAPRQ